MESKQALSGPDRREADSDESNRLTPSPVKARNRVLMFTADETERCFTQINFTA